MFVQSKRGSSFDPPGILRWPGASSSHAPARRLSGASRQREIRTARPPRSARSWGAATCYNRRDASARGDRAIHGGRAAAAPVRGGPAADGTQVRGRCGCAVEQLPWGPGDGGSHRADDPRRRCRVAGELRGAARVCAAGDARGRAVRVAVGGDGPGGGRGAVAADDRRGGGIARGVDDIELDLAKQDEDEGQGEGEPA